LKRAICVADAPAVAISVKSPAADGAVGMLSAHPSRWRPSARKTVLIFVEDRVAAWVANMNPRAVAGRESSPIRRRSSFERVRPSASSLPELLKKLAFRGRFTRPVPQQGGALDPFGRNGKGRAAAKRCQLEVD